jgi:hypothetical protein
MPAPKKTDVPDRCHNVERRIMKTRTNSSILITLILAPFVLSSAAQADCRDGCSGNNTFLGEDALLDTTNSYNTGIGYIALYYGGDDANTATGALAMANLLYGSYNTAIGYAAMLSSENKAYSDNNTATGAFALYANETGTENTASGVSALYSNTTGNSNTAIGVEALSSNTTASNNVAVGSDALTYNTTGSDNVACGVNALFSNDSGSYNTATGSAALASNTSNDNTATGQAALNQNTIGADNTATGFQALLSNISGAGNTANGVNALYSNSRGSNNIGVGIGAGGALTTGDNNIDIGNAGVAGESAKIRIGTKPTHKNTYIAGIYGVTVSRGIGVIVDSTGHLGTTTSSARFKDNIKPMDKTSEAILSLQPVTFRYKHDLDPDGIPQFGLVAEDVAKVNPDLVARDEEGKPYTVRYEAVNAMLLNEFLKEHCKNEQQEAKIADQQKQIEALTESFKEQAAQIQKVSAQLAASRSAPRLVVSNQ